MVFSNRTTYCLCFWVITTVVGSAVITAGVFGSCYGLFMWNDMKFHIPKNVYSCDITVLDKDQQSRSCGKALCPCYVYTCSIYVEELNLTSHYKTGCGTGNIHANKCKVKHDKATPYTAVPSNAVNYVFVIFLIPLSAFSAGFFVAVAWVGVVILMQQHTPDIEMQVVKNNNESNVEMQTIKIETQHNQLKTSHDSDEQSDDSQDCVNHETTEKDNSDVSENDTEEVDVIKESAQKTDSESSDGSLRFL